MIVRSAVLILTFSLFAGFSRSQEVAAATLGIPASAYPRGAHISYSPHLSNHELDCQWGLQCELGDVANFHTTTQSLLGRLRGWAQYGRVHAKGKTDMGFELFASRYQVRVPGSSVLGGKRPFTDFETAIHAQGYEQLSSRTVGLQVPKTGGAVAELQHLTGQDLTVMAVWKGNIEIEGISSYSSKSRSDMKLAWKSLRRQVALALKKGA